MRLLENKMIIIIYISLKNEIKNKIKISSPKITIYNIHIIHGWK